jgi:DNA repair protein RecO (recombination protein O)
MIFVFSRWIRYYSKKGNDNSDNAIKTKAIVLSSIKFQEKSLIVKCFTESDGLKSYFVQSAYSNKKANQKIAYFQPLTMIEIEANHKNKGTLEHFKEIRLAHSYYSIIH